MPSSAYPLRSAGWGNQPRQLAMDPLSKISQIVLPPRQGPRSLLPQQVPDSFAKVVPEGQTPVPWRTGTLGHPVAFEALCQKAGRMKWVVYAKRPFGGPEQVLKYLARYTHRVAISNRRLLSMEDGRVTFEWKDYADGNQTKTMTLEAVEFIRRFLLHVLPSGFVHIRHFGFLANRKRKEKLALCRSLLAAPQAVNKPCADSPGSRDSDFAEQHRRCPVCQTGRLIRVQALTAAACACLPAPSIADTS